MSDRVTYVGHGTVRLEIGGSTLLTDPLLRDRFLHIVRAAAPVPEGAWQGIDAVLISHLHPDHLDFPSLRLVGREVELLVPAGARRLLARHGFRRVTELRAGEATAVGELVVRAVHAVHDGRRFPIGPAREALGFEIRAAAKRAYFAGDTGPFEEMAQLAGVDLALLPIAGWGTSVGRGHLDPWRAAEAAARIHPRTVVPIHWGTYLRAGLARRRPGLLTNPPRMLAAALAERAPGVELRVLRPGEALAFEAGV